VTYADLRPTTPLEQYIPKIFGFKIHKSITAIDADGNNNKNLIPSSFLPAEAKPSALVADPLNQMQSTSPSTQESEETGQMGAAEEEVVEAREEAVISRPARESQPTVRFADEVNIDRSTGRQYEHESKIVDTESITSSTRLAKRAKH
jgi:hypothetical protein